MVSKFITVEDGKKILYNYFNDPTKMVNVVFTKDRQSVISKMKIISNTLGSEFKLKSKGFDNHGEILNYLSYVNKRYKDVINIICVPKEVAVEIECELPDKMTVYYVSDLQINYFNPNETPPHTERKLSKINL